MTHLSSISDRIRPILGAIRTVPVPPKPGESASPPPRVEPFITISREPGAGGWFLAKHLVDALNRDLPADQQQWTCWDRELVEKVAGDLHLSTTLVNQLEDRGHSWVGDFFESLSFSDEPGHADEAKVYSRIAATVRALAQAGRVVLVGCGGVFIARKMPGGIHIRLVAPFESRVEFMVREYHLPHDKAAARVRLIEHNRYKFFKHFWPNEKLDPETFTLTINTAAIAMPTMVQMLATVIAAAQRELNPAAGT